MSDVRLYLFDDRQARRWAPLTLTRPVGELLYGCLTQRTRAEHAFGTPCLGHITRSALVGFDEPGAAPGLTLDDVVGSGTRILLSSRAVPDFQDFGLPTGSRRITVDGRMAGWVIADGDELPSELWIREPGAAPTDGDALELAGEMLGYPWDLIERNSARIAQDVAYLWAVDANPDGIVRVGDHVVSMAEDAVIEPGVHVDVRHGPIRLDRGARVEGPARLTGPLFVGESSTVLGGAVGAASIGPVSLVRGEVTESVLLGFVNKAHDGHLGHAYLGRWVNLGAFTTNSDLKNNYRSVRVWTLDGEKDTGILKVGCFIGDHVKTGIGTVLNTGTVIGAGSNVYGGVMPPSVVPPFSWGAGADLRDHRLEKFMATTRIVMGRRGQGLTPGMEAILRDAWEATAGRRAAQQ